MIAQPTVAMVRRPRPAESRVCRTPARQAPERPGRRARLRHRRRPASVPRPPGPDRGRSRLARVEARRRRPGGTRPRGRRRPGAGCSSASSRSSRRRRGSRRGRRRARAATPAAITGASTRRARRSRRRLHARPRTVASTNRTSAAPIGCRHSAIAARPRRGRSSREPVGGVGPGVVPVVVGGRAGLRERAVGLAVVGADAVEPPAAVGARAPESTTSPSPVNRGASSLVATSGGVVSRRRLDPSAASSQIERRSRPKRGST